MEKIDLHMHSNYSDDADLPVDVLIARCQKQGISTLAVTDHNRADSVAAAKALASSTLNVLSGIEIDCTFEGRNYHLLGYGFTPAEDFAAIYQNFSAIQRELTPQKFEKLRELNFYLDEQRLEQVCGGAIPQEEQMGEVILEDERNDGHPLLLPYRAGGARADMPLINFYWDFFGPGKVCYMPVTYPAMSAMAEVIRDNGGIPIVAHIGANVKQDHTQVIDKMLKVGVMGLEVFSSYHSPKLADQLYDFAVERSAFVSCGSDFHGRNKPKIEVGQCAYGPQHLTEIRRLVAAASA
ncbi:MULTISPECIES: PHP domain-containing protein [unclassified Serratia (in: enterobacteria)]|uniref:PHP domain-containing protein n=1 Tax=unclassified Serratia (in: enterobacteria) TaxID=2647522 RepID=UPI0005089AAB|nr:MULTISPECIES: PHP domain-containing protein [unclassified Serratia (in: enterobacteria)]KFK94781.1 histidinol phosphatase [Serratia sp. Ag2]KFK99059.1 histidinol phosphatase [Serratia sp. Ag1]